MSRHRWNHRTAAAAALAATLLYCIGIGNGLAGSGTAVEQPTLVIVVRHAEKAAEPEDDPPLTMAGRERAEDLADRLRGADVAAVYSTQFQRTRATGRPLAERLGLPVTVRAIENQSVAEHSEAMAREIAAEHADQAVLVVGHSNTVPQLVEALSGHTVDPIHEREYDRLYIVWMREPGAGRVIEAAYPAD